MSEKFVLVRAVATNPENTDQRTVELGRHELIKLVKEDEKRGYWWSYLHQPADIKRWINSPRKNGDVLSDDDMLTIVYVKIGQEKNDGKSALG